MRALLKLINVNRVTNSEQYIITIVEYFIILYYCHFGATFHQRINIEVIVLLLIEMWLSI